MTEYYWRVKRSDNGAHEYTYSTTAPTVAPSDGGAIIASKTCALKSRETTNTTSEVINLESSNPSSQAIKINASHATGGVEMSAGTGGTKIGCNANAGPIKIGDTTSSKSIVIGNSSGTSKLTARCGSDGLFISQFAPTSFSDANQTATTAQLLTGVLYMSATANRTITLPTATSLTSAIADVAVNDAFDFTIIQNTTGLLDPTITLAMGTGGTSIGNMVVPPATNTLVAYKTTGCGRYRLRFTNVTNSPAYVTYRIS